MDKLTTLGRAVRAVTDSVRDQWQQMLRPARRAVVEPLEPRQYLTTTAWISGAPTVVAGHRYLLNLSANSTYGNTHVFGWSIDWGDGTSQSPDVQSITGNPSTATHVYTTAGTPEIIATPSDDDGSGAPAVLALDSTFGTNGVAVSTTTNSTANAMAVQSDSKTIVVGTGGNANGFVQRFNADGSLDTSFGNSGSATLSVGSQTNFFAVAIDSSGKILAAGEATDTNGNTIAVLARFTSGGALDTTFGSNGEVVLASRPGSEFHALQVQSDGKIVAGGWVPNGQSTNSLLRRYNADGSLDTSFGTGGEAAASSGYVYSIALQSDGKVLTGAWGSGNFIVSRYNVDGSVDTSFGTSGVVTTSIGNTTQLQRLLLRPSGKIVAVGYTSIPYSSIYKVSFVLARYNTDGSLDTTFGTNGIAQPFFDYGYHLNDVSLASAALDANGKIIVAGSDKQWEGWVIGRYNTDGTLDTTFGNAGFVSGVGASNGWASDVSVLSNGQILAAGTWQDTTPHYAALARYTPGNATVNVTTGDGTVVADPPTVSISGNSIGTEGQPYTLNLSAVYPPSNSGTIDHWTIDWGDGTPPSPDIQTFSGNPASVTHSFVAVTNPTQIKAVATDADGSYSARPFNVKLSPAAPTNVTGTLHGSSITVSWTNASVIATSLTIQESTDGGSTWPTSISVGGTATQAVIPELTSGQTYTFRIIASNSYGQSTSAASTPATVADGASPISDTSVWLSWSESSTTTITILRRRPAGQWQTVTNSLAAGSKSYIDSGLESGRTYNYQIILSSGTINAQAQTFRTGDLTGDGIVNDDDLAILSLNYGKSGISYLGGDLTGDGSVDVSDLGVMASNFDGPYSNPTISATAPSSVVEGSPYALNLSYIPNSGNTLDYWQVVWGDGSAVTQIDGDPNPTTAQTQHTFANPGSYNVGAVAIDARGQFHASILNITVKDIPPTVALSGASTATEGVPYTLNVNIAEHGQGDLPNAIHINWGDGTIESVNPFHSQFLHTYTSGAGVYHITATTNDNDGGPYTAQTFTVDQTFGAHTTQLSQQSGTPQLIALDTDGNTLVAGTANGSFTLSRFTPTGVLDSTFGTSGTATTFLGPLTSANAILVETDGKILVGGTTGGKFAIARYNSDGTIDIAFGTNGILVTSLDSAMGIIKALAVEPDGSIIAAGTCTNSVSGKQNVALAKYDSSGQLDKSFGSAGSVVAFFSSGVDTVSRIGLQSDGKIVLVGSAGGDFAIARYTAVGVLDSRFGSGGIAVTGQPLGIANSMLFEADGSILLAGIRGAGSSAQVAYAKFTAGGLLDASYGTNGIIFSASLGAPWDEVLAQRLYPDGTTVICGAVQAGGSKDDFAVARYNPDGTLDATFGNDGLATFDFSSSAVASALAIRANGKIVTAGTAGGDLAIAEFSPNAGSPSLTVDVATPPAPSAVGMESAAADHAVIAWADGSGQGDYIVEWSHDSSFATFVSEQVHATADTSGTMSFDTRVDPAHPSHLLNPDTTYYFRVRNAAAGASFSAPLSILTTSTDAPTSPDHIYARALSATQVELTWDSLNGTSANPNIKYVIESSTDGVNYSQAGEIDNNPAANDFVIGGLTASAHYMFRLRVVDSTSSTQSGSITTVFPGAQSFGSPEIRLESSGSAWTTTQTIDTSGWYVVSTAQMPVPDPISGPPGNPLPSFTSSVTPDHIHTFFYYGYPGHGLGTWAVIDLDLCRSLLWASSPLDAIRRAFTGTITFYDQNDDGSWSSGRVFPYQGSSFLQALAPTFAAPPSPPAPTSDAPLSGGGGGTFEEQPLNAGSSGGAAQPLTGGAWFNSLPKFVNTGQNLGLYWIDADDQGLSSDDGEYLDDPVSGMTASRIPPSNQAKSGGDPVRLSDGQLIYSSTDLSTNIGGVTFGQTRSWSGDAYVGSLTANGNGMVDSSLPYVLQDPAEEGYGFVVDGAAPHWFYNGQPSFNAHEQMSAGDTQITYTQEDGTTYVFYGFGGSVPAGRQGRMISRTDPGGTQEIVTSYTGDGKIEEVRMVRPGVPTTQALHSYLYSYFQSGANAGQLQSVTLRQRSSGSADWQTVRQAIYTYYSNTTLAGGDVIGNPGDLQTAEIVDASGNDLGTSYYRYYARGNSLGQTDRIRYIFNRKAFARLSASVTNPLTAPDAAAAPFATLSLSYDSSGRVQQETIAGLGAAGSSGFGNYSFTYLSNPDVLKTGPVSEFGGDCCEPAVPLFWMQSQVRLRGSPVPSAAGTDLTDYNTWWYKTVITNPDSSTETVYSNAAGEPMLDVVASDSLQSATYYQYDNEGRFVLKANPSAVTGYDANIEKSDNLLTDPVTSTPLLSSSSGLIEKNDYGNGTSGVPVGYLKDRWIEHGTADPAPTLLESLTYVSFGNGFAIYPASDTVYPDGSPETTTYTYGPEARYLPLTQSIAPPAVGDGPSGTTENVFDVYGQLLWTKDLDGFLNYAAHDPTTGGVTQQIIDVQTGAVGSPPSPPASTPAGGGLNIVANATVDALGRPTMVTDPNGNVTYYTYDDPEHEYRVYPGWHQIGTSGTYTTTGPVQVHREDWAQNYTEDLTYATTLSQAIPDGTDPIINLRTLSRNYMNVAGQVDHEDRYFNLAGVAYSTSPNLGTINVNYYRTTYGYDHYGRQNEVTAPTGTITKNVYDALDQLTQTLVGTSELNLTDVADYTYDNGGSGDGNLTQVTLHPSTNAADDRITEFDYDWRDRAIVEVDGAGTSDAIIHYTQYDNLDDPVSLGQYAGNGVAITSTDGVPNRPDPSLLRAEETLAYDEQGRVYRNSIFSVDPITGAVGSSADTNFFYDGRGDVIATQGPTGLWTKDIYDGAGRIAAEYQTDGASGTTYAAAASVAGDHVLTQTTYQYDGDGNLIFTSTADRFHNDSTAAGQALGALGTPTTGVGARVSYQAFYYDAADRLIDAVDFGTNGGAAMTAPPAQVPARSDTALVTGYAYDDAGWLSLMTDPKAIVTAYTFDALDRLTQTIENFTDGTPTDSSNRTTDYTYDGDGNLSSQTAVMPTGQPSETTAYVYGVSTTTGSGVNSNDLLAQVQYPDPATGRASTSQEESYTYDTLGQRQTYTDRNGTTHQYTYDALGRLTADQLTHIGPGVDGTITKLGYTYDDAGQLQLATTYDSSGNMLNQVKRAYDGFGNVASEAQSHSGMVTGSTPSVAYAYDAAHGDRLSSIIYPNGRSLSYNYNAGIDNTISRLSSISDASGTLESYQYLGLDTPVMRTRGNGTALTFISPTASTADAGDQYTGLDRFGRVVDQSWVNTSTGQSLDEFQYGYDRDSNVLFKQNAVNAGRSQLFSYDLLNRLTSFQQGMLNSTRDGISGTPSTSESWTLDALGNWKSQTVNGVTTSRTNNAQNQVTQIGSATLGCDANGNTTTDDQGHTLVYDGWNQLVGVKSGSTTAASYSYDALGRRTTETHSGNTTDLYYSQWWQVVEERQNGANTASTQYVWSPVYIDALMERDDQPNGSGTLTRRLYAQQDANFDTTSLTDATGNVVERYVYDSSGNITVENPDGSMRGDGSASASSYAFTYLYQGGRLDPATSFYNFRNRDYSPTLGLWIEQDPAGYIDSMNRYAFIDQSPVNGTDPLGLQRWWQGWGNTIGIAIGLGPDGGAGQVWGAAGEGAKGGASIVANTVTHGYSDQFGLTNSTQYQGGDYDASRVIAQVGDQALETAALAGAGNGLQALRACKYGTAINTGARAAQALLAGKNLYDGARGIQRGIQDIRSNKSNAWTYVGLVLSTIQAAEGIKGLGNAAGQSYCFVAGTQVLMAPDPTAAAAAEEPSWFWTNRYRIGGAALVLAGPVGWYILKAYERKKQRSQSDGDDEVLENQGAFEPAWVPLVPAGWQAVARRTREQFSIPLLRDWVRAQSLLRI